MDEVAKLTLGLVDPAKMGKESLQKFLQFLYPRKSKESIEGKSLQSLRETASTAVTKGLEDGPRLVKRLRHLTKRFDPDLQKSVGIKPEFVREIAKKTGDLMPLLLRYFEKLVVEFKKRGLTGDGDDLLKDIRTFFESYAKDLRVGGSLTPKARRMLKKIQSLLPTAS